jgi:uroporphyrin-III C-methyltransferase/precorrin-2 dehydrogenase/sirohydrochlorin ferrochelatase
VDFLPLYLDLKERPCLVVGGGPVAARKAALLVDAGAQVTVIAPELAQEVAEMVADGRCRHLAREFQDKDIGDQALVIAGTDDHAVNARIAGIAQEKGMLVNVADEAKLGNCIMPSIIDRSPVQIAVSTGGASPVLARLMRTRLESCTPSAYGNLASLVESYRDEVKRRFPHVEQRRKFWEGVLEGPIAELVFAGRDGDARAKLTELVEGASEDPDYGGEVYLVGAGPGDPDLLTFRALRLMQQADVVVYDRLVSKPILELVRRDAERIYAGKEKSKHAIAQEDINDLLVRLAKEGKRVLRLKGGDPFIFGRGGEEIATLIDEGVPFQIVPGITAASGCATYSGIPLTHRDHSQACIMVTGHLKDGTINLNWEMLSHANQTVVFYMGLHGVEVICRELIAHGRDSATPAALVEKGTTPKQRVLVGNLETLPTLVREHDVGAPTLIIVGEVVALHEKLHWFKPGEEIEGFSVQALSQKSLSSS